MLKFNSILVIISDNHQKQTKEHSTRRSLPATTSWDPSVVDPQNVVILRGVLEAQRASVHLDDLLRGKAVEAVHVQVPVLTSEVLASAPQRKLHARRRRLKDTDGTLSFGIPRFNPRM